MTDTFRALCAELTYCWSRTTNPDDFAENAAPIFGRMKAALDQPEPKGPTDEELIRRLLLLAEQAVKEALDFEYEDPEDRYIWRELQELKQLVKEANGQA
jgi:hypothetical protein